MMALCIILVTFELCASSSPEAIAQDAPHSAKKYKLSVCALFKNEARYLKEWIEYNRLIGVEHFYLYNNGSRDRSVDVLIPYVRQGIVTLVDWPDLIPQEHEGVPGSWALSTQVPAYGHAAKYLALGETEWLALIDVDEYIVPVSTANLTDILDNYDEYPGIRLVGECFDASTIDALPKRELLIATSELVAEPPKVLTKSIEKMILNRKRTRHSPGRPSSVSLKTMRSPRDWGEAS